MMRTKLFILCGVAIMPLAAYAQFDFGGGSTSAPQSSGTAWSSFKLNTSKRVSLNFRNASADSIIQFYQQQSGVTIVKDPALTDRLSITSAKAVSLNEAFQILSTTLSLKGYNLEKEGNLLVIKKRQERGRDEGRNNNGMPGGFDITQFLQGQQQQSTELRVYPIKFANASQLARVLNDIFAQSGGGGFQFPGGGMIQFGGQGGRGGRGGFNPAMMQMGRNNQQSGIRASADDFSNSVVVNAPRDRHREVKEIIDQLDKVTEAPQQSKTYKLEFASATDAQQVIQNVLNANAPRGRGGANAQQSSNPFTQMRQAFGGGAAGAGTVVADARTNSLVVTATDENQAIVEQVIKEIDTEVKVEAGTFVFPLSNARADDVATLLQSAFGNRQGSGGGNRNNFGGTGNRNQNRNNQNRNNNNNAFGGARLGGDVNNPDIIAQNNSLPIELEDPNAEGGLLATNVAVAQFGGGFFGGQQNRNQNTGVQGRNAQGQLTNVQDPTGQVTIIPDVNTNSVIVVTTPDNADLVRQILGQLDKIPEQVMIETMIVEASLDSSSKLGVQWDFNSSKSGTNHDVGTTFPDAANTVREGLRYTLAGTSWNVVLDALKKDDKFSILSTPRIFTSNNTQAEINISQRVPYVTSSREDVNGNFTFNYAFEDVGIVLNVTPRITSNGYVTMDVTQTANDLQGYTSFNAPIINQRQADTTVSVKDGETIVLGGIIRNSVTSSVRKVPLLGDIPILGELFKSTSKTNNKTELLVFLTPRIVRDDADAKLLRERNTKELSKDSQKQIGNKVPPPATGGANSNGGNK